MQHYVAVRSLVLSLDKRDSFRLVSNLEFASIASTSSSSQSRHNPSPCKEQRKKFHMGASNMGPTFLWASHSCPFRLVSPDMAHAFDPKFPLFPISITIKHTFFDEINSTYYFHIKLRLYCKLIYEFTPLLDLFVGLETYLLLSSVMHVCLFAASNSRIPRCVWQSVQLTFFSLLSSPLKTAPPDWERARLRKF